MQQRVSDKKQNLNFIFSLYKLSCIFHMFVVVLSFYLHIFFCILTSHLSIYLPSGFGIMHTIHFQQCRCALQCRYQFILGLAKNCCSQAKGGKYCTQSRLLVATYLFSYFILQPTYFRSRKNSPGYLTLHLPHQGYHGLQKYM